MRTPPPLLLPLVFFILVLVWLEVMQRPALMPPPKDDSTPVIEVERTASSALDRELSGQRAGVSAPRLKPAAGR
jgi:hypothetical protein